MSTYAKRIDYAFETLQECLRILAAMRARLAAADPADIDAVADMRKCVEWAERHCNESGAELQRAYAAPNAGKFVSQAMTEKKI